MIAAKFIQAIIDTLLSVNAQDTYRALLRDEELNAYMREDLPPAFLVMVDLYSELTEEQREKLFASLDLSIVDTIAKLLGMISGSVHLPGFEGGFDFGYNGQQIGGDLAIAFLEAANKGKQIEGEQ